MLPEIVALRLVFFGICCTMLSVDNVIVNHLFWRCLFDPEISSVNKFFVIKRTSHWLSTTRTPKIVTIYICLDTHVYIHIYLYEHTEFTQSPRPPPLITEKYRNFGNWRNTCLMNSRRVSFSDKIFNPERVSLEISVIKFHTRIYTSESVLPVVSTLHLNLSAESRGASSIPAKARVVVCLSLLS